ncbi:MAG: carbohydrate kinase family protein [Ignavibacteriaceae bacterium]|jgi:sugar/nucleoside kinase (ribokinase family)|nr:carbohydrate kinase family protein [Ignavibacteriaceae bacterium]MCU0413123.1 carbohydrate kinase family protein [Ignavibacteriaceae bacterium]
MNILAVGQSVVDIIIDRDDISIKPGGIFYTVVSFLSQLQQEDKIFLCSSIDKENEILFKHAYDKIEKKYLYYVESIPKVELVVDVTGERKETYSQTTQNLLVPSVDLNRFDGILINMISGYDVSLYQLKNLRANYDGLIYFDVHTFSRGVDKNLNRIFRRIENFNEWAGCIDILQANESEMLTLSDQLNEASIVDELFSYGIRQVIVTRAEKGVTVFYKEQSSVKKFHKEALKTNVVNKVGCGDVFGAVYFYNYIKNKNVTLTLEQANLIAGVTTTLKSIEEFLDLKRYANEWISKK